MAWHTMDSSCREAHAQQRIHMLRGPSVGEQNGSSHAFSMNENSPQFLRHIPQFTSIGFPTTYTHWHKRCSKKNEAKTGCEKNLNRTNDLIRYYWCLVNGLKAPKAHSPGQSWVNVIKGL